MDKSQPATFQVSLPGHQRFGSWAESMDLGIHHDAKCHRKPPGWSIVASIQFQKHLVLVLQSYSMFVTLLWRKRHPNQRESNWRWNRNTFHCTYPHNAPEESQCYTETRLSGHWPLGLCNGNPLETLDLGVILFLFVYEQTRNTKHLSISFVMARHHSPAAALWPCWPDPRILSMYASDELRPSLVTLSPEQLAQW